MLTDFKNSFTARLSKNFAAKLLLYFSQHLKRVVTLPCEIRNIKNSKNLPYLTQQQQFSFNIHKLNALKLSLCVPLSQSNAQNVLLF